MEKAVLAVGANRNCPKLLPAVREGHCHIATSHGKAIARTVPVERNGAVIAVGLTPEFLPMISSVTLARGAICMARDHVVVKHLPAMQNFGTIDVLCSDKTCTLARHADAGTVLHPDDAEPAEEPSERASCSYEGDDRHHWPPASLFPNRWLSRFHPASADLLHIPDNCDRNLPRACGIGETPPRRTTG